MLTASRPEKNLFIYLSVSDHAMSVVLLKDQGVQQPVSTSEEVERISVE